MNPLSFGMSNGVIVEGKHGLRAETIGVLLRVVSVGMMSPMLRHPIPFTGANEIGTKSKKVVDPRAFGNCSVVGIVLHIQPNKRLGHTERNGHGHTALVPIVVVKKSGRGSKLVLHEEEKCNVGEGTEEVARRCEFTSAADYFKHFGFDLALKGGIEFVLRCIVHHLAHHLHLLQMLPGMIRMDHLILHRHIIPTKESDHLSSRMVKVGNVIDDSVNSHFSPLESLERAEGGLGRGIIGIDEIRGGVDLGGNAVAEDAGVGVWRHGAGFL
mmetsp:Transcript_11386/g.21000  ORF Transcript_11386/g.21000 Transcript_11386/m.21000 type:complete len:270 (-) Transcript_11386:132-941(-)